MKLRFEYYLECNAKNTQKFKVFSHIYNDILSVFSEMIRNKPINKIQSY